MLSRISLKYRIALVILALEAAMMAVVLWQTLGMGLNASAEREQVTYQVLADVVGELAAAALLTTEYAELQLYLNQIRKDPTVDRLLVADVDGTVVAGSPPHLVGQRLWDVPGMDNHALFVRSVAVADSTLGTLAIEFSNAGLHAVYARARNLGIGIAVAGMALIAAIGLLAGFTLTRRLDRISAAVQRLADGDPAARTGVRGHDELGALGQTVDRMMDTVARQRHHLEEARRRYASLVSNLPGYAYRCFGSDAWTPAFISDGIAELTGIAPEQLVPRGAVTRADLIHPEDRDRVLGEVAAAVQTGNPFELVYRIHTDSGATRWVWEKGHAAHRANGSIEHIDGFVTDITKRIAAEQALRESDQKHRLLFETMAQGVVYQNADKQIIAANPAAEDILGLSLDQMRGRSSIDPRWKAVHEDGTDFPGDTHPSVVALRTGEVVSDVVMGVYHPQEGRHRWILVAAAPQFTPGADRPHQVFTTFTDITSRKASEQALRESEARLRAIMDHSPALISIKDLSGRMTMVNRRFEVLDGPPPEAFLGKTVFELFPKDIAEVLWSNDQEALAANGPVVAEEMVGHRDGTEHTYLTVKFPLVAEGDSRPFGVCAIATDITERKATEERMRRMAYHDTLTGLVNRHQFEHRLEQALASAKARQVAHALLYIDLDQFKVVNDTCGHGAGDELLRQIAALLLEPVRSRDTVSRLGGDEFAILLETCPLERATTLANRMIESIRDYRFVWDDNTFSVGASIGVVAITQASPDVAEVMKNVDMACYAAKDLGRGRIHVSNESDAELTRRRREMHWVSRIRAAVDDGRFTLWGQPIVALQSSGPHPSMCEVFVQMRELDGTIVSPDSFIPAAERFGLMPAVDRWVIRAVCAHIAQTSGTATADTPAARTFFVNLSGTSLNDTDLPTFVREQVEAFGVAPPRLCFELTETAAVANFRHAKEFIRQVRDLGCHFALDDFGSGLSSFSYLKALPIDYLKIDGTFVRNMLQEPMDCAIVEAIQQVGRAVGVRTIAESVENTSTRNRLRSLGIDYAQGHGIERPLPLDALDAQAAPARVGMNS